MEEKEKKFSTQKFVLWLFKKIEAKERTKNDVANDLAHYINDTDGWVQKCEGKTKTEVKKLGFVYDDTWFK